MSFSPSLMAVVVLFFWGKIGMVRGCCGFGCEIGVGMVVYGSVFVDFRCGL